MGNVGSYLSGELRALILEDDVGATSAEVANKKNACHGMSGPHYKTQWRGRMRIRFKP